MATTIKLYYTDRNSTYKEWELIPNKLLIVEDIASYLLTKSALSFSNIQYIKNELELGVNLDLSQSYAQPKTTTSFKYVSIQNEGELIHYYFVKKVVWRSKSTIRLELVMDVLNTFEEGKDYEFKENTRIIREHKSRIITTYENKYLNLVPTDINPYDELPSINDEVWIYNQGDMANIYARGILKEIIYDEEDPTIVNKFVIELDSAYWNEEANILSKVQEALTLDIPVVLNNADEDYVEITFTSTSQITFTTSGTRYFRNIDFQSEGINPLLIRDNEERIIQDDKTLLSQNWYLLYRNQNDPDESLLNPVECYLIPQRSINTNSAYIEGGRLIPSWLEEGKWYLFAVKSGSSFTLSNGVSVTYQSGEYRRVLLTKAGNKISAMYFSVDDIDYVGMQWQYDDISYIDITGLPVNYNVYNSSPTMNYNTLRNATFPNTFTNSETYSSLDPISNVDRTDAKNIKLIKLPYCPYDFNVVSNVLQVAGSTTWEYASITQANGGILHALKLINLNTKLDNDILSSYNPFLILKFDSLSPNKNDLKNQIIDSKLYHSEFYSPSFVYDSFSFKIDLEKCETSYYYIWNMLNYCYINFSITKTINSRFLFTFTSYVCDKNESNFYNVMPIARNNEEVLYNVPYINYVRTGFNYDVKTKNQNLTSNIISTILSGASIGASLLFPSAPLKVAGVVSGIVSFANSIKNTISTTIQNENNLKQKILQTQNQASSVAGSDDVDLMSEYCQNRLQYFIYKPTAVMESLLKDLFFYAGYSSNRMGIPTHNNRLNFDYLECEAQIQAISSIPEECLTELINSFRNGCTYLHKTTRTEDKWDFAQKYENWERNLIGE